VPRYGKIPKRKIPADAVYASVLVQKFINRLLTQGKKSKAEKIVYVALEEIGKKLNKDPLEVFNKAIDNATPFLEVKARRVGGATYQIPIEVTRARGQALAMKWLLDVARGRNGKSMIENLSAELMDAYNRVGGAVKKREDLHKTADANRAFAHFRW